VIETYRIRRELDAVGRRLLLPAASRAVNLRL
jgi:hypothetical protein